MEVRSVNSNYEGRIAPQNIRASKQPNFTGAYSNEIMKSLPQAKTIKQMEALKWLKGEIGGILITAVGTGLVAPIFIGFNPFVRAPKNATPEEKEEIKNTKEYTAMRQPISAVLAILFQASVQKYIDKGLDKVFNNPKVAQFARVTVDQSSLNTESRIKDNITKEMKNEGKKKPSWIRSLFSKEAKEARKAYKEEFESRVKARQNEQIENVAKIFQEEGLIKPGERQLKDKTVAKLVNQQIEEYIRDAKDLKKSPERIDFYAKRAEVLTTNEDHLREIFKEVPFEEVKEAQKAGDMAKLKTLYRDVENAINKLLAEEKNTDVKDLLEEIKAKPEDLRAHRVERTLERIDTLKRLFTDKGGTTRPYSAKEYADILLDRNKVLDRKIYNLTTLKIDNPEAVNAKNIQDILKQVAEVCDFSKEDAQTKAILENTDTFGSEITELTKKVFKDVTKKYKKLVENHYKSWNQFTKIGIGVFITLPITCTALNWVYPRFMELFFPKLAGVKKQQMQKHQQQSAPQQKVGGDK